MDKSTCGQMTKQGRPCGFPRGGCRWHDGSPAGDGRVSLTPAAVGERDPRGLAWWTIDTLLRGELSAASATVVASLLRVIAGLGPGAAEEAEALAETAFRGRIMHGLPPSTPAEWERAERNYTPEAVAEFRRWEALLEADRLHDGDELVFGEGRAIEGEDAFVIEDEDS